MRGNSHNEFDSEEQKRSPTRQIFDQSVGEKRSALDPEANYLPYRYHDECLASLEGVESIDYFFAQYMASLFNSHIRYQALSAQQKSTCFHLLLALSYTQRQGSSCLILDSVAEQTMWAQQHSTEANEGGRGYRFPNLAHLQEALDEITILTEAVDGIVCEENRLYTEKYYTYEQSVCAHILYKVDLTKHIRDNMQTLYPELDDCIKNDWSLLFPKAVQNTSDWQQIAVMQSLCSAFSIISGGAGTGKTYTLSRLLVMLVRGLAYHPQRIALVAPTGKAVNRLALSLKDELDALAKHERLSGLSEIYSQLRLQTVHRLLGIHPLDGRCKYDQERLLPFDWIVLDEASMVDLSLMHKLLRATDKQTRVVIVGDAKQLPSVETGCLLADMVLSAQTRPNADSFEFLRRVNSLLCADKNDFAQAPNESNSLTKTDSCHDFLVSLQQVRRSEGVLVRLAEAMLNKNIHDILSLQCEQFMYSDNMVNHSEQGQLIAIINQHIIPNLEKTISAGSVFEAWDSLHDYACLVPNRKGFAGVEWLNQQIEYLLSYRYKWVQVNKAYQGKAIMITQNDYSLGLYNGDVGIIWPDEKGEFWAHFPTGNTGSFQAHSLFTLPSYESVFAMTIHKTQGSEYQHVDILLPQHTQRYLSNELLYTAVTRAKKSVRIVGDRASFEQGIGREVSRVSGIANKLMRLSS